MARKTQSKAKSWPGDATFYEQLLARADEAWRGQIDWDRLITHMHGSIDRAGPLILAGLLDFASFVLIGLHRSIRAIPKPRKSLVLAVALASVGTSVIVGGIFVDHTYRTYAADLDNPKALVSRNHQGTTITDRGGNVLYRVDGADNSIQVKFADVPRSFVDATLAAEDPGFYSHDGVSLKGTARAAWEDLTHGQKVEGGSTLSQQLVKTAFLKPEKSYTRKLKEMVLATMLERKYTKNQILELYFNEVPYGQGSTGAQRAAQTYFHKNLSDLTLGEQAMLAGLPLGTNRFDPNFDPAAAKDRRDYILGRMQDLGYITAKQASAAKSENLVAFAQQIDIKAPHFVFFVLDQLRQAYGEDMLEHGGITVKTTLDLSKQQIAEEEVQNQISQLARQHVTNAGLVSLDPKTGEVLAMVGSVDFNNQDFGKVNVTLAKLQPGSSFKPFVYATAFKKGWTGATVIQDTPIALPDGSGQIYRPVNYDGKFRGPVLARRALGNSFNIPALRTIQFAGVADTIQTAKDLGISTLGDPSQYGISLALGSGEVTPYDMVQAYGTFAELGTKVSAKSILEVDDRYGGNITKETPSQNPQVLDPRIAYMLVNILGDNSSRVEEFGPNSPLLLPRPSFAKTGTTNDFRDNFTAGSTPDLTTVVWVGNNDHSPMIGVNGITGAAPIWHNYMVRALAAVPPSDFVRPAGLVDRVVCSTDGGLANPWDHGISELFLAEAPAPKPCASTKPEPPKPPDAQPDANLPKVDNLNKDKKPTIF